MQASETIHRPTRCGSEHWVKAKDGAGVGTGARTKLAHDAVLWNRSHGAKKKSQISNFSSHWGLHSGNKKGLFLSLSVIIC